MPLKLRGILNEKEATVKEKAEALHTLQLTIAREDYLEKQKGQVVKAL